MARRRTRQPPVSSGVSHPALVRVAGGMRCNSRREVLWFPIHLGRRWERTLVSEEWYERPCVQAPKPAIGWCATHLLMFVRSGWDEWNGSKFRDCKNTKKNAPIRSVQIVNQWSCNMQPVFYGWRTAYLFRSNVRLLHDVWPTHFGVTHSQCFINFDLWPTPGEVMCVQCSMYDAGPSHFEVMHGWCMTRGLPISKFDWF